MATVLKCKMCGGDIDVSADMSVGTCLYCGSTMTLPRIDSEKKARLFNRANEYRQQNEFDKAFDAYEAIVAEDEQEAEAYWGLILSEYGVEYVRDPKTGKRIPTCHRTHVKPIRSSVNYERALRYADAEQRLMYRDEAEELDRIQRGILAVSGKEEPFDVFICYKELEDGTEERTADSVLAQSIYEELEREGLRTFFARITLEDKLGTDYEPYIYSALRSARVMLVVSTTAAHCEAVWVKNEWKRFLAMMEDDRDKVLIPVFRDMPVYEFPPELSKFQSQDMSKIGALQDLIHGVKKLAIGRSSDDAAGGNAALQLLLREREEEKLRKRKRKRSSVIYLIVSLAVVCLVAAFAYFGWIEFPGAASQKTYSVTTYESVGDGFSSGELTEPAMVEYDAPVMSVSGEQTESTVDEYDAADFSISNVEVRTSMEYSTGVPYVTVTFDYSVPTSCYAAAMTLSPQRGTEAQSGITLQPGTRSTSIRAGSILAGEEYEVRLIIGLGGYGPDYQTLIYESEPVTVIYPAD